MNNQWNKLIIKEWSMRRVNFDPKTKSCFEIYATWKYRMNTDLILSRIRARREAKLKQRQLERRIDRRYQNGGTSDLEK